jgi:uncharacterized membrane protein
MAMVMAHVSDSWTMESARQGDPWYIVAFVGGVASPLFLFLAGVAIAMSAASKGARVARRRGWEIFGLGLLFRVQSQILGMGPLDNLFKVDMLNIMGLSMVAASYAWQVSEQRRTRVATLAILTGAVTMMTPLVRDVTWLAVLPDPIEAYLRPEGRYAAFPFFPWGGFLFAGVIVGDLAHGARRGAIRNVPLQNGLAIAGGAGVMLSWLASFQPSIYESASFWHDSPTFFFIRLGIVTLLVPMAWVLEQLLPTRVFMPLVTFGHSSLFVYWIHVEMVYGIVAEPIKRSMPLAMSLAATAALCMALYGLVLLKNKYRPRLKPVLVPSP